LKSLADNKCMKKISRCNSFGVRAKLSSHLAWSGSSKLQNCESDPNISLRLLSEGGKRDSFKLNTTVYSNIVKMICRVANCDRARSEMWKGCW